jgi:hypothetical protein
MKKLLLLAILSAGLTAKSQVSISWVNYPGGVAVAADASNNVYTANWDYNPAGDITLTKRDANGNIIWEVPYNNTITTRHEVATWVDTDSQGNILVSGTIRSGYSNPVNANSLLMKFSPSGTLLWRVVYETDFDGSSTKKCLIDPQNNIYVLGLGNNGTGVVTKIKKFSSAGTALWSYFDTGGGAPINFKFTPDNKIVISKRGITGNINAYTKIDLNGNLIWNTVGINSLPVGDAAGDSYGNTYLVNGEYVTSNAGSIVKKLSPTGAVIWEKVNTMTGMRVEVGTDNNPVICGYPTSGTFGAAFMKYNSDGNVLWQNLDADGPSYNLLSHAQMKLDASNAAYLAASIMTQMAVCKVNSDGTSAWTATLSGSYAYCMDFATDNSVFVVGGTTAKLSQSGTIPSPPAAPSNLAATSAGTTSINLTWTDNSTNETGFVLMQSSTSGGIFNKLITIPANTTSYTDAGLNSSATYYYKIQATNAGGNSVWSNEASAKTATPPPPVTIPAAPSNLTAVASGCNAIKLAWLDNSTNETSFELRRATSSSGTYTTIATLAANTTTYTNTGLTKGKRYYYMVRATNSAGNSAWSNKANTTATCTTSLKSGEILTDINLHEIKLYPNPVNKGIFYMEMPQETAFPVNIQLFSIAGQKVFQRKLFEQNNAILTDGIKNGIYILVVDRNNEVKRLKLIINNL